MGAASAAWLEPPPKKPPMAWPIEEPTATPLLPEKSVISCLFAPYQKNLEFQRGIVCAIGSVQVTKCLRKQYPEKITYAAVEAICPNSPEPPLCCPAAGACCVAGGAAAVLVGRDGCCGGRAGAAVGREGALRAGVRPRDWRGISLRV